MLTNETMVHTNVTNTIRTIEGFTFALLFVTGLPLICVGLVTSVLSIIMFFKDTFTPRTTKLVLKTLSMADIFFLTSTCLYIEAKIFYVKFKDEGAVVSTIYNNPVYYVPVTIIVNYSEMVRNYLTVLIGIERYVVTCHPFYVHKFCTLRRTRLLLLSIILLSLLLRVPIIVRRICTDPAVSARASEVHNHVDMVCLWLVPAMVLTFCSTRIIIELRRSQRFNSISSRTATSGQSSHQRSMHRHSHVTRMLLVVVVGFVVGSIPSVLFTFFWHVFMLGESREFLSLCWFTSIAQSVGNFFIYIACVPRYRLLLCRIMRCAPINDADFPGATSQRAGSRAALNQEYTVCAHKSNWSHNSCPGGKVTSACRMHLLKSNPETVEESDETPHD